MDVATYYRSLAAKRAAIVEQCVADPAAIGMHTVSHNFLGEIELLLSVIPKPEKAVLEQACREFQYSLEAVICGNYRHAFTSLRLAFELFVATVYFSAYELKLRLWLAGQSDLLWSVLNDSDAGVFSHVFSQAFNPGLAPHRAQYMGLAATVYRECSQYVHGNPSTHEDPAASARYDFDKLREFHERVETIRVCVIFAFALRYLNEFSRDARVRVEPIFLECLGHIAEVQAVFEKGQ